MKKLIAVIAVLMIFSSISEATYTRLCGLGLSGNNNSYVWMVNDDYNIWLNPAYVSDYSNSVWLELGTGPTTNQWGGLSFRADLGLNTTFGVFFAKPYTGFLGANIGENAAGSDVTAIPTTITSGITGGSTLTLTPLAISREKIAILMGLKIADQFKLGFSLDMASNSSKEEYTYTSTITANGDGSSKLERSVSDINLGAGVLFSNLGLLSSLSVSGKVGIPSLSSKYNEAAYLAATPLLFTSDYRELKLDSAINMSGTARAVVDFSKSLSILADFNYNSNPGSNKYTINLDPDADGVLESDVVQTRLQTRTRINGGFAVNAKLNDSALLIAGVGLHTTKEDNKASTTNNLTTLMIEQYNYEMYETYLPIIAAFEYKLSKVFTVRAGASKNIIETTGTTYTDPNLAAGLVTNTAKTDSSSEAAFLTSYSFGLSITPMDNLTIDAVINSTILFSNTYLMSGVPANPVSMLTVKYNF
jgi:hypothetical protein